MSYCTSFWRVSVVNLITCFFSCLSFLTTLEALEIIVLPAPSYNQHQQRFVEKLTDYPQVIGQKITVYKISPQLFIFFLSGKQLIMIISWVRQGEKKIGGWVFYCEITVFVTGKLPRFPWQLKFWQPCLTSYQTWKPVKSGFQTSVMPHLTEIRVCTSLKGTLKDLLNVACRYIKLGWIFCWK